MGLKERKLLSVKSTTTARLLRLCSSRQNISHTPQEYTRRPKALRHFSTRKGKPCSTLLSCSVGVRQMALHTGSSGTLGVRNGVKKVMHAFPWIVTSYVSTMLSKQPLQPSRRRKKQKKRKLKLQGARRRGRKRMQSAMRE